MRRTVRLASVSDLPFIDALTKKWNYNIGFLTKKALTEAIAQKHILLTLENNQPAGFLNWGIRDDGLLRIYSVAIEPELLRTTLGTKICHTLERAGRRASCSILRLTSRQDLPANQFWPSLGFHMTAVLTPKTKKGLLHLEWTKPIYDPTLVTLAINNHVRINKRRTVDPLSRTWYNSSMHSALKDTLDQDPIVNDDFKGDIP